MTKPCSHCGGTDIVYGVRIGGKGQEGRISRFGLEYRKKSRSWLEDDSSYEPLVADICRNCGTITRFWLWNTEHEWVRNS